MISPSAQSCLVDVDDGLCKGLRRLLRQVMAYAAGDVAMLISGNVRGIDIILVLLWLMTFEALFDDIRHDWLLGISLRPKLKTQPPVDAYFVESFAITAKPFRAPST
jgi:hypothetical protein